MGRYQRTALFTVMRDLMKLWDEHAAAGAWQPPLQGLAAGPVLMRGCYAFPGRKYSGSYNHKV